MSSNSGHALGKKRPISRALTGSGEKVGVETDPGDVCCE